MCRIHAWQKWLYQYVFDLLASMMPDLLLAYLPITIQCPAHLQQHRAMPMCVYVMWILCSLGIWAWNLTAKSYVFSEAVVCYLHYSLFAFSGNLPVIYEPCIWYLHVSLDSVTWGRFNDAREMQRISLDTWIIPCVLDSTLLHIVLFCTMSVHVL